MPFELIDLKDLERPGRYLGHEIGAHPNTCPDLKGQLLTIALSFPDVYEIAHSHLGHKILYHLFNSQKGFSAERVYAPWLDMESRLRTTGKPLSSLENHRPLATFDVVGFSLQYEMTYTNILNMLELGKIPLLAKNRGPEYPLIVAGGPGAANPEPLADFFDIFFLGDAEASLLEDYKLISAWKAEKAPKEELYRRLAGRDGIYIPSLFEPVYEGSRFTGLNSLLPGYDKIKRAAVPSLAGAPFPLCQITPFLKPVHDRVVVEITRGCSRGCRFCQAGYIYRPVRERHPGEILALTEANLLATGHDEAAFLALSAGDHSKIEPMVEDFMDRFSSRFISLSLPSLRVKSMSENLARQIKRVRKTGFTLAPEAATERLRAVINKDLTEDDIMNAAETAFSLGWRTLKLYFMCGLPTETNDDLSAIGSLARKIKKMSRAKLNLGLAHFTPKAHTPFQWHPASREDNIRERLNLVRDASRSPGLTPKWNDPGASWVEGLLARGDRRLGRLILNVHQRGARFEAWSDQFQAKLWREALDDLDLNEEELIRGRQPGEALPWAHLQAGVHEDFLKKEYQKALSGETTSDCRLTSCHNCGACDKTVKTELATQLDKLAPEKIPIQFKKTSPIESRFLASFSKKGPLIFLGHLELMEVFKRAFRRATLELVMKEGFHPQPKLSFLSALPMGVESEDEKISFTLCGCHEAEEIKNRLILPENLEITSLESLSLTAPKPRLLANRWLIETELPLFKAPPLHPGAHLRYTDNRNNPRDFALKDFVLSHLILEAHRLELVIKAGDKGTPKPLMAAQAMWGFDEEPLARLSKLESILEPPH